MIQATRVSHCQIDSTFTYSDAVAYFHEIPLICAQLHRIHIGHSCSVSCTGSNEETGCSLHVTNRFPIDPWNPRGPVVAPSSASNRWRRGRSLAWMMEQTYQPLQWMLKGFF